MEIAFDYCWVECFIIPANFDGTVIGKLASVYFYFWAEGILLVEVSVDMRYNLSNGRFAKQNL